MQLAPFLPVTPSLSSPSLGQPFLPLDFLYEPGINIILDQLLPKHLTVQLRLALTENAAGEQGARMTAMDGATHNAEEMMETLSLTYNRTRQSYVTKELIEIIGGANALNE